MANTVQAAIPKGETTTVAARLLHYVGEGLKQADFDAAAWWLVSRFATVLPADRVVLLDVTAKPKLVASDAGVENIAISEFVDDVAALKKAGRLDEVAAWGCHDSANPLSDDFRQANSGCSVVALPFTASGRSWLLWLERWNGVYWQAAESALLARVPEYLSAIVELSSRVVRKRWKGKLLFLVVLVFALFPVRDDIAAELKMAPKLPHVVFAPLDGIIKEVRVRAGQKVALGQSLFSYDEDLLRRQLAEAEGEWRVALAESERLQAAAYQSADARAQLKVQDISVQQAKLRVNYLRMQLDKITVVAPVAGVIDFEDRDSLLGAYLRTGEKAVRVIDERDVEAQLYVPIADAGRFSEGAEVRLRLSNRPLDVLQAKVETVGFDVVVSDGDVPSIKVLAALKNMESHVRAGVQGSATIRAGWTVMAVRVLRKPFNYLAAFFGL